MATLRSSTSQGFPVLGRSNKESEDEVNTPCIAYSEAFESWQLPRTLLGGTAAMRAAAEIYLPKETKEDDRDYKVRLGRSFLYNAYKDACLRLASGPFQRDVNLETESEDAGAWELLGAIEEDADRQGRSLTQFLRESFEEAVCMGVAHILVDYPQVPPGASIADERELGVRPYFVRIPTADLIGWKTDNVAGRQAVTEIRWRTSRVEPVGKFGEELIEQVRVMREAEWETWEKKASDKDDEFKLVESGTHTFGGIPLVSIFTNRTGDLTGSPPLESLAWVNLAHWQSDSDQRNILRFARLGILFAAGFSEEEIEQGVKVGVSSLVASTNEQARLEYVEHSGQAIGSGERDLDSLESRMDALGMSPFLNRATGQETATGQMINHAKNQSQLQAWISAMESAALECLRLAFDWAVPMIPEDLTVQIFSDFAVAFAGNEDAAVLISAREKGQITQTTLLRELKRRNLLQDTLDIEAEVELLDAEASKILEGLAGPDDDAEDDLVDE